MFSFVSHVTLIYNLPAVIGNYVVLYDTQTGRLLTRYELQRYIKNEFLFIGCNAEFYTDYLNIRCKSRTPPQLVLSHLNWYSRLNWYISRLNWYRGVTVLLPG